MLAYVRERERGGVRQTARERERKRERLREELRWKWYGITAWKKECVCVCVCVSKPERVRD